MPPTTISYRTDQVIPSRWVEIMERDPDHLIDRINHVTMRICKDSGECYDGSALILLAILLDIPSIKVEFV